MQIFRSLDSLPAWLGRTVLAIGNFDGVHRGHQAILSNIQRCAAETGAASVAVTFDPHPVRVLRPAQAPKLITPLPQKLALLAATGIEATVVIPFTQEFSRLSPLEFAERVLLRDLKAAEVHEGDNFRFGHNASAGPADLAQLGRDLGFKVVAQPSLYVRGIPVSSSYVRRFIAEGDMTMARALLGRPFSICSSPMRDRGVGSRLTVPTINMAPYDELLPASGVYITRMKIDGEYFNAVTNAGHRPTFGGNAFAIESHLLNFREMSLTPETQLELCFLSRIRDERRFESPAALKEQILRDAAHARRYFNLMKLG
ncbi:MAG TPA: bifunctional riboflavin kinase/FAD synthetase [Acidobacteriaceae bacterium]|nr:bifunctional riboflavin kinase/FAD synthetase [Acidobacteriaceae bacterium]